MYIHFSAIYVKMKNERQGEHLVNELGKLLHKFDKNYNFDYEYEFDREEDN